MAKISFRQGIVSHPKHIAGQQTFLDKNSSNNSVGLVLGDDTTKESVVFTIAHGETDYLYTESESVEFAWTDCSVGQDYWLYWDISLTTGELTRGKTTLEPLWSATQPGPALRIVGQMWFDTTEAVYKVWQGSTWLEVLRVIAAKLNNGTTFSSFASGAGTGVYKGTQIGSYSNQRFSRRAGSLVFKNGKAIKSGQNRQFFTTEDTFLTGVPTGASLRINNQIIQGKAQCPIAAYQIVQFNDYDKICLANVYEQGDKVFGVTESDVNDGETVSFVTEGIIYNEDWDWRTAGVPMNTPVYIDNASKELTTTKNIADKPPVGMIIGPQEIYFAPRLFPTVSVIVSGGGGMTAAQQQALADVIQEADINAAYITSHGIEFDALVDRVTTNEADITALEDLMPTFVQKAGSEMTGYLTLAESEPNLPYHATPKQYVDNLTTGFQSTFDLGHWSGTTSKYIAIPASIHGMPLGIIYDVIVFDDMGNRVSSEYTVNDTTGEVILHTNGPAFSGKYRIK